MWGNSDTIAIDCLHGDVVDQIDGGIDGMVMWWKAHVSVNRSPIAIRRSVCPTHPKLSSSNPHFDTNPHTNTGRIRKVAMTISSKFGWSLVIDRDFHNHIGVRGPIR